MATRKDMDVQGASYNGHPRSILPLAAWVIDFTASKQCERLCPQALRVLWALWWTASPSVCCAVLIVCAGLSAYHSTETPWWASEWHLNLIMKAPLNQKREKCLCLWHKVFCVTTEVVWEGTAVEIVIQVCQQWLTAVVAMDKFQLLWACFWRFWY